MPEATPLYGPGYTIAKDRFGNSVDVSGSLTERACINGYQWRIDTGYKSLGADGNYLTITFTTPAASVGTCLYTFSAVNKTGSEVLVSLFTGPTIAGGTAFTPYNFNENISTACPLTAVKVGLSTDGTPTTITGGTEKFISLIPGTAQGNYKPGAAAGTLGEIILKPSTVYATKIAAKGGAVTLAADISITIVPYLAS